MMLTGIVAIIVNVILAPSAGPTWWTVAGVAAGLGIFTVGFTERYLRQAP